VPALRAHVLSPHVQAAGDHTLVCIEGPAFSTKAESNLYRSWGASVVGMTNLTEVRTCTACVTKPVDSVMVVFG
jgi:purine nucleoside phosphorylase